MSEYVKLRNHQASSEAKNSACQNKLILYGYWFRAKRLFELVFFAYTIIYTIEFLLI